MASLSWKSKRNGWISWFIETTEVKWKREQQPKETLTKEDIKTVTKCPPTKISQALISNWILPDFKRTTTNPS